MTLYRPAQDGNDRPHSKWRGKGDHRTVALPWYNDDMMIDRITVDPKVCQGRATVRGTRITVDFVLKLIGNGYTPEDVVREYPELKLDDVYQCATYGAWLASDRTLIVG